MDEEIKKVESELGETPEYSSEWISAAAKLMVKHNISEDDINYYCGLDADKVEAVLDVYEYYHKNDGINDNSPISVSIASVIARGLNSTQIRIMLAGIQKGVPEDVLEELVTPNIPYAKSNYILQAYIDGFNMRNYINYSIDQIYEIFAGFKNGVDVTLYDCIDIDAYTMGLMRHALEIGKHPHYDLEKKELTIN